MKVVNVEAIRVISNPRKNFSAVDDLAKSIKEFGLLQPLAVRIDPARAEEEPTEFILIDGECRLRALKKLKISSVPVHILNISDDQGHKEAQMIANLQRSDLSMIERMRGYVDLLENAPAKYNEKVIANKFGLKERDVKQAVSVARKIDKDCDELLASGRFNFRDFEVLSRIPSEYQMKVVKQAMTSMDPDIAYAANILTESLYFDDVFTLEKAKAAGKVHFEPYAEEYRTFDRAFAAEVKKEYEARTNKNYKEEAEKSSESKKKAKELTAEQKKAAKDKAEKNLNEILSAMKTQLPRFLSKEASEKTRARFIEWSMGQIFKDNLKGLMLALGLKWSSDLGNDAMRKAIIKGFIEPMLHEEKHDAVKDRIAINLYEFALMNSNHGSFQVSSPESFKKLASEMKKAADKN